MLTSRQQEIYDFISEQQSDGLSPSTREIQARFGFKSRNAVSCHLKALEDKDAMKRQPHKARGIILKNDPKPRSIQISVYGTIPAGFALDQQQESEGCVSVGLETLRLRRGAKVFALKVRGDSMTGAGILSGDIVVLEKREPRDVRHNDIVAALIDGETTLKRYDIRGGKPFLKAENPEFPDLIPARELIIQGVQIALLRVLKQP